MEAGCVSEAGWAEEVAVLIALLVLTELLECSTELPECSIEILEWAFKFWAVPVADGTGALVVPFLMEPGLHVRPLTARARTRWWKTSE